MEGRLKKADFRERYFFGFQATRQTGLDTAYASSAKEKWICWNHSSERVG